MSISDLLQSFEFHDGLLDDVVYDRDKKEVRMVIDFCYWMQEGYRDEDPETGMVELVFRDVSVYEGLEGEVDSFSVLHMKLEDRFLLIGVLDDDTDEFHEIRLQAGTAQMNRLD